MNAETERVRIAEALGWKIGVRVSGLGWGENCLHLVRPDGVIAYSWGSNVETPRFFSAIPDYHTDPSAALQIVEFMRGKGYVVRLDNGLDGTWEAIFTKRTWVGPAPGHFYNEDEHYGPADTLPAAICAAFLKWVEEGGK